MTELVALHAYAAGIVDGEGSIGLERCGGKKFNRYAIRVIVGNTSEWLCQLLASSFGGSLYLRVSKNPKHQDCWIWSISSRKAADFLMLIMPYLQIKRPQAELALSYQSRRHHCGIKTDNERVLDEADRILMKSYNNNHRIPDKNFFQKEVAL